jgi:putative DNA primase/helicase
MAKKPGLPLKQADTKDWKRFLLHGERGMRPNAANAITILVNDPAWAGVLAYDEFAETIITRKVPPWRPSDGAEHLKPGDWTDEDTVRAQCWIVDAYGIDVGIEATLAAVKVASARTRIHPVRDYLSSLKWDGKRRVRSWLIDIMRCDDTPYIREVSLEFLVSAVARAFAPGCKVDTMPILEGEQGTGKSSVIRALAGDEWFLEMSVTDIANKDAMQILKRKWIAEFPEFDGFSKSEASHVKGYCSRQVDTYRPSYGKGAKDFPRQTVFAGSTNKNDYLVDETGARRFYPVQCRQGDVARARADRDQLWAEAVALYESGVAWHVVDPELYAAFRAEQDARFRSHPWEETIAAWLAKPLDIPSGATRAASGVTVADVLEGACRIEVGKRTDGDAKVVAGCLRRLGWLQAPQSRRSGARVRLFFPKLPAESLTNSGERDPEFAPEESSGLREMTPTDRFDSPSDADLASLSGE